MMHEYIRKAKKFLMREDAEVIEIPYGLAVAGGNFYSLGDMPAEMLDKIFGEFNFLGGLRLNDRVFHHHVLILREKYPIRSHEETDHEFVVNIGEIPVEYVSPPFNGARHEKWQSCPVRPGANLCSIDGDVGFYHGFDVLSAPMAQFAMIYVAKALHTDFIQGDFFRTPANTYRGPE